MKTTLVFFPKNLISLEPDWIFIRLCIKKFHVNLLQQFNEK